HDLVLDGFAGLLVFQFHSGTEDDLAPRIQLGRIDDLRCRQLALDVLDATLDESLTVLRSLVFSVFTDVALRAGFCDRIDDARAIDSLEPLQLFAQLLGAT